MSSEQLPTAIVADGKPKRLVVPEGFQKMLEELATLVIQQQPSDIEKFSLDFFSQRVKSRYVCVFFIFFFFSFFFTNVSKVMFLLGYSKKKVGT